MIGDTSNTNDRITVSWTNDVPGGNINTVTLPKCKNPLCTKQAVFGSDYCDRHGPDGGLITDTNPDLTDIPQQTQPTDSGPSRRDLQRQLDRLEGKIDSLINALQEGDNR